MRLSVLVPARNAADTIALSLRSTLRALPADSEVLVLDDASVDGTGDRARALRDNRVRVIRSESPSGVAGALNALLGEARGEFVARMDADDVVLPGRFHLQLARLTPKVDILFGGVLHFGSGLRFPHPSPPFAISPEAFPVALLIDNPVAHSTMLARRSVIEELSGYRKCLAEDYDLWLRAASRGLKLARLASPVTALRRHGAQVTADVTWAERAAAESEWQESYSDLAVASDIIRARTETADRLRSANSITSKRILLRSALDDSINAMGWADRLALRTLMRRTSRG